MCVLQCGLPCQDVEISKITEKAEEATENSVFVALKGTKNDGNGFTTRALKNGAAAVLTDIAETTEKTINVDNVRRAYAKICANFYGFDNSFKGACAVTGTNGKTTTVYMLEHIATCLGGECCIAGSIENRSRNICLPSQLTTADPPQLYGMLSDFLNDGAEYLFMEASSHSLALDKISAMKFDVGIVTNITSDHLDFHKTRENYISAKAKLACLCDTVLLNKDDEACMRIKDRASSKKLLFSVNDKNADFCAKNVKCDGNKISFDYRGVAVGHVTLNTPTHFNVYNAVCAIAATELLGYDGKNACECMESFGLPKGRFETITDGDCPFKVVIDFSHTPDALENILKACKNITAGRVILVFGCGGDRDREKRPRMGRIATRYADYTVITADNSRSESTPNIIKDILKGIDKNSRYGVIENRKEAIINALNYARSGDCVLLAGKGHEEYEITKDGKRPFSERDIVKGWIESNR